MVDHATIGGALRMKKSTQRTSRRMSTMERVFRSVIVFMVIAFEAIHFSRPPIDEHLQAA